MTTRDRLVLIGLGGLAVVAAIWLLLVSPAHKQIAELNQQVASAQQTLSAAESNLSDARAAETQYQADYAAVVRIGEAVPASPEIPSLVYELDQLSKAKDVNFASITSANSSSGPASSSSSSASSAASPNVFTPMPFTFTFNGTFFDLYSLLHKLDGLALERKSGGVQISGRLLTIQSANLAAATQTESGKESGKEELTGTITATAYVLPTSQGLTAGATPAGPAGVAGSAPQPAAASSSSSSGPPAAVTQVTP